MDAGRHPLIKLIAYSEVKEVTGTAGNFRVKVERKARYVDEKECTACGECAEKCPGRIPNEFDMGLGMRRAIYLYFPQGIPAAYTIDRDHCLMLLRGRCGICQKLCKKNAIDFEQKDWEETYNVGAIIVATGFEPFDPSSIPRFGYGRIKNVITSMEFERLISASGPTGGHLVRPSDRKMAEKIGFIQCVGSRDIRHNRYCSSVCCMHSTKEAILAREHNPKAQSYIFYTDIRAVGKGFQDYVKRAQENYGVKYINGRAAEISVDDEGNPIIWHEDIEGREVKRETVDIAVLATSLTPPKGIEKLAEVLGVQLDEYSFFITNPYSPIETTKEGVFACGYSTGPVDIPESVAQASAAAARASEVAFGIWN